VGTSFNWFTGVAGISVPCPPELRGGQGLRAFYADPNNELWGPDLPRWLYHESLHFWQLVSSSYLQALVAGEWDRVLSFEADGVPPPASPIRTSHARRGAGEPFSVRELVECLARLWDVMTRGSHRLIREEGDTLQGRLAEIEREREQRGNDEQSQWEFDAFMSGGRDQGSYGAPYVWMRERARSSNIIAAGGDVAAVWAVMLLLPIAGRIALNTPTPVASFIAAFDSVLQPEVLQKAVDRRNALRSIALEWLGQWVELETTMWRALGLDRVPVGETKVGVLKAHPVYRYLDDRVEAIGVSIGNFAMEFQAGRIGPLTPMQAASLRHEVLLALDCPWAVLALPGQPSYRWLIGGVLAPPLTRFADVDLPASRSVFPTLPWPIPEAELEAAVRDCESRHGALQRAEAALKLGLPQGAFANPPV